MNNRENQYLRETGQQWSNQKVGEKALRSILREPSRVMNLEPMLIYICSLCRSQAWQYREKVTTVEDNER